MNQNDHADGCVYDVGPCYHNCKGCVYGINECEICGETFEYDINNNMNGLCEHCSGKDHADDEVKFNELNVLPIFNIIHGWVNWGIKNVKRFIFN